MATMAELEDALRNADAAGDTAAARRLADEIVRMRTAAKATQAKPANVFDQFDDVPPGFRVVQPGPVKRNVFDQFDDIPPGFRVVQPAAPARAAKPKGNVFDQFDAPAVAAAPMSTAADAGLSLASGVPRGLIEAVMSPLTLNKLSNDASGWLYDKARGGVRSVFGMDPAEPGNDTIKKAIVSPFSAGVDAVRGLFGEAPIEQGFDLAQDTVRTAMDDTLHKPQTTTGEVLGTIGEFAAPGGLPSRAARMAPTVGGVARRYVEDLLGNVVAPAIVSEGAGQATEGTAFEGPARFAGAAAGNVGTAGARAYNAPEAVVRRATSEMTDDDWTRAVGLQNNPTGVKLTGPEAISQATDGASALPNVQRVVEGSVDGRARTAPFFAERPGQVDTAVSGVLDRIAPQSPQPYNLGPRAAKEADNVINGVRQDINAQTRPLYKAAEPQFIPSTGVAPAYDALAADPRFQAAVARLRGNPELGPEYANLPDNSIGVVDAVTKDMMARGEAMRDTANPLYGPELGARTVESAATARNAATTQSPEYAQALAEQEALRRAILEPIETGPVGRVAAANTLEGASAAILPHNPPRGSAGQFTDATTRLIMEDPATTRSLVRQNLGDRYTKAATETQEGDRSFAGAKFHKDVAGNATRDEVLDAVMRAVGEQPAAAMAELLPVLPATGRRKPIGSATEFNRGVNVELGDDLKSQLLGTLRSLGTSLITNAGDRARRASLRGNIRTLADLFVDPHSVEEIRNAVNRGVRINLGEAAGRTAAEVGGTLYDPLGGR